MDLDIIDDKVDETGFVSDTDEVVGQEREAAVNSPPKKGKRVTSDVSLFSFFAVITPSHYTTRAWSKSKILLRSSLHLVNRMEKDPCAQTQRMQIFPKATTHRASGETKWCQRTSIGVLRSYPLGYSEMKRSVLIY